VSLSPSRPRMRSCDVSTYKEKRGEVVVRSEHRLEDAPLGLDTAEALPPIPTHIPPPPHARTHPGEPMLGYMLGCAERSGWHNSTQTVLRPLEPPLIHETITRSTPQPKHTRNHNDTGGWTSSWKLGGTKSSMKTQPSQNVASSSRVTSSSSATTKFRPWQ
jgi:hypothetical protein